MQVTPEMYEQIRKHAVSNYNTDGWDFIVETMEHADVQEIATTRRVTTYGQLVTELGRLAKMWHDFEQERSGIGY